MGAAVSSTSVAEIIDDVTTSSSTTRLGDIPESCISFIMKSFDPKEICQLAKVNKTFHRASSADFVWESKLPQTYNFLLNKVLGDNNKEDLIRTMTKKEVYAKLCRPNFFDGGTKEVWLDRKSGQVCLFISSKSFKITGIDDRRYWNNIPTEESRFKSVAYLQQMWWVEVLGEVDFEFPRGKYSIYFRLHLGKTSKKLGRRVCDLAQVHGWDIKPVRFQLSTSDGQNSLSQCYLSGPGEWAHYHVGDFVIDKPNGPKTIKFSLAQIDCTHTKGGLCIDGAVICPTEHENTKQF
ncbi:hypothetical protein PIB30_067828 [Stylosanthes scabra]|uniref:F-box domain-containing protein n=1 Tax=Stylosanthes scabra TaxID=79078 RepID=A0ABU6UM45_9FABA|nr:hypothetical protein [Stylosanthes scabra]